VAITDGKIQFKNPNLNTIEVDVPILGYITTVKLPLDITKLNNGLYTVFDHASAGTFDTRQCQCVFQLNATEQATFEDFLRTEGVTKGRGQQLKIMMNTKSGFFPFGPDKGDVGEFDVVVEILDHGKQVQSPYLFFETKILMTAAHTTPGSWPAYSLPAEVKEGGPDPPTGNLKIGTVTDNRFPPRFFKPKNQYAIYTVIEEDSSGQIIDRGSSGDGFQTSFEMVSNESKAAAVIEHLNTTVRNNTFDLGVDPNSHPFGKDIGDDGTYTVRLIQNNIKIMHELHNRFNYKLELSYESGPV